MTMDATARTHGSPALEPPYEPEVDEMLRRWMRDRDGDRAAGAVPYARRPRGADVPDATAGLRDPQPRRGRRPRDREIVLHRTCARAGAEYEWGVHAVAFAPAGGSQPRAAQPPRPAIPAPPSDPCWSDRRALLIRLADELHDTATVSDELWAQLSEHYTDQHLLELIVTAGWYRTIA